MVYFESHSKTLVFLSKTQLDGETYKGEEVRIDLREIPEGIRQLVIASCKLTMGYCNGNKISEGRVVKTDTSSTNLPSIVEEFNLLVKRSIVPKSITPKEAAQEASTSKNQS